MAFRFSMRARRAATAYLFILPFFAVFGLFWAGPIAASFLYSFTEWRGITPPSPVGLRNYENLLHDERFFTALGNTLWMAGLYVAIANAAALSLALALDSGWMRLRQFFRARPGWDRERVALAANISRTRIDALLDIEAPLTRGQADQLRRVIDRPLRETEDQRIDRMRAEAAARRRDWEMGNLAAEAERYGLRRIARPLSGMVA